MKIIVNPHNVKIIREETEPINELEVNISKCLFEFDERITEDFTKEAYFTLNGNTYKQTIIDNECDYPSEVLVQSGTLEVGVVAYKVVNGQELIRYNPTSDYFSTWEGSLKEADNTEPITPTDKEQMQSQITQNAANISNLQTNKQDKLTAGDNITIDENNVISAVDTIYDDTEIKADIQELQETKVDKDVNNLTYYTLTTETGSKITLSIDSSTYIMTLKLKDKNNNDISTANVDLPLETMVVGARYDSTTKEIVLTLKNGQEVRFSVADLVSGLQTEITENNKLSSDLVDDTNNTNKFVSASEKAQITTNKNDILAIKNGQNIDSFADVETALNLKEDKSNKVTEINSSSIDTQYPSAKCVYDSQEEQNEQIAELEMLYNAFPTVSAENETIQLDNTAKVKFREIDLKGNTSQVVIPEEQGTSVSNTSINVSDVNTSKEHTIEMSGNTSQETTTGKNLINFASPNSLSPTVTTYDFTNDVATISGTGAYIFARWIITDLYKSNAGKTLKSVVSGLDISQYDSSNSSAMQISIFYNDETPTSYLSLLLKDGTDYKRQIPNDTSNVDHVWLHIYANNSSTSTTSTIKFIEPMLIFTTSSDTPYEPYTNGASPNPSYPQNIEVVTGTNNIEVCGKNLFDKNATLYNGYITQTGEINSSANFKYTDYIPIAPSTTYTTSGMINGTGSEPSRAYYDKNKNFISGYRHASQIDIIDTSPSNARYMVESVRISDLDTIMIEKGSTATTYEQYQGTTYPINLGNIELCKINTYQDKIYKRNDKWYLEKQVQKYTFTGDENGNLQTNNETTYLFNIANQLFNDGDLPNYTTNYFNNYSLPNSTTNAPNNTNLGSYIANKTFRLRVPSSIATTYQQFKTWLSTANCILYYPLATPTTTEITDTTLVNQLNALYNATIYSTTNINTDTSNLLPYIDLHYNFVTPSPSPSRPSNISVVTGNNTITISNSDNTESQVFPINIGDMELCKIETYQDYIYENNGNWYKKSNIGKYVYNNDLTINGITDNYVAMLTPVLNIGASIASLENKAFCNILPLSIVNSTGLNGTSSSNKIRVQFSSYYATTYDEVKSICANNNLTIYYQLATPTDTQITDTTLITQLNNIKKAYSYDTQTNISQTNTDKPFIIYAEAIRSLKDVFE